MAGPGVLQRGKEVQQSLRYLVVHPHGPSDTARAQQGDRSVCRVLGTQHHGGCHGLWLFWSPRTPSAGQGWERQSTPQQGSPAAAELQPRVSGGLAWPGGQGGHGVMMMRALPALSCTQSTSSAPPAAGGTRRGWAHMDRDPRGQGEEQQQHSRQSCSSNTHFPAAMNQERASTPGSGSI